MSYSKLIHDYLDGELEATQEEVLFAKLAQDPELRLEFNQQLKFNTVAQADMSLISPPVESTNLIFASLGFNIPSSDFVAAPVKTGFLKNVISAAAWQNSRKYFAILMTAVISAALTASLFMLRDNNGGMLAKSADAKPVPSISQYNNNLASVPVIKSEEFNQLTTSQNPVRNSRTINNNNFASADNFTNQDKETSLSERNNTEFNLTSSNFGELGNNKMSMNPVSPQIIRFAPFNNPTVIDEQPLAGTRMADTKFSVRLRAYSPHSMNPVPVTNNDNPWLLDKGLAAMYQLNEYHTFGIEVGQEKFDQKIETQINGKPYTWSQKPTLFWYGGFYRLTVPNVGIEPITNVLFPYLEVFGGGNNSNGFIGKVQTGLQWKPERSITLFLGYEYGILWYRVNQTYNSQRSAFTYGISFNF